MNKHDGFKRGSGCFICADCGKRTRATKRDGADSRLCADCFEFAGRENEHSDNGHEGGPKVEGCPVCCGVKSGKEYAEWDGETDMSPRGGPEREERAMTTAEETLLKTVREFEDLPDGAMFWEGGGETGVLLEGKGLVTRTTFFRVGLVRLTAKGREVLATL